ncbi:MAG: hypothetical protein PHD00_12215, partial [Bacteroidales bacterium]|nr:hypothetical protein [Bacteroidales bacterium]
MKRTILTLLLLSLGLVTTIAQTELGMNYQAVIRDAEGHIVANTTVGIQIQILQESTSGTAVYTETFTPTTNEFGLINLIIGQGQAKYGKYADIDWSMAKYFLRIELDITGGTTYEEMGTSQLLSVPYANYAFDGVTGKSAYQAWLDLGNTGTQEDFINSLTGPAGEAGPDGKSAYQTWLDLGNTGTQEDFINSLTGPAGEAGPDGKSAYQAWLDLGNTGTQEDFINSLTGPAGEAGTDGESAYQAWLNLGNTGTQENFINSLTGPAG